MTHFHHMVTLVNYVTSFYDITLMNCPLSNLNKLCLPIHWKLLLMCTCTKLSFIQSSCWGYFPRINRLEIGIFSKLWMHVQNIIYFFKRFPCMYVKKCVLDVSYIIFCNCAWIHCSARWNGNVFHKVVT